MQFLFDTHEDPGECLDLSEDPKHHDQLIALRTHLMEWMQKHGDPRAEDGKLIPAAVDWRLDEGTGHNLWNNRGRH